MNTSYLADGFGDMVGLKLTVGLSLGCTDCEGAWERVGLADGLMLGGTLGLSEGLMLGRELGRRVREREPA